MGHLSGDEMRSKTKGILIIASLLVVLCLSLIFGFYLLGVGVLEGSLMMLGAFVVTGVSNAIFSKAMQLIKSSD